MLIGFYTIVALDCYAVTLGTDFLGQPKDSSLTAVSVPEVCCDGSYGRNSASAKSKEMNLFHILLRPVDFRSISKDDVLMLLMDIIRL